MGGMTPTLPAWGIYPTVTRFLVSLRGAGRSRRFPASTPKTMLQGTFRRLTTVSVFPTLIEGFKDHADLKNQPG